MELGLIATMTIASLIAMLTRMISKRYSQNPPHKEELGAARNPTTCKGRQEAEDPEVPKNQRQGLSKEMDDRRKHQEPKPKSRPQTNQKTGKASKRRTYKDMVAGTHS